MKKSFCGLPMLTLACVLTFAGATTAQAGEINANEARLVSAASGTFTYEGKTYIASSQYVGELRSYLCKDDVDLSAEDVSSLISDMYANVETGVKDGYLEEVGGASDGTDEDPDEESEKPADGGQSGEEASDGEAGEGTEDSVPAEPEEPSYTVEETPQETKIVDTEGSVIFLAAPMIKSVGYHKQTARSVSILIGLMFTAIVSGIFMVIRNEKA